MCEETISIRPMEYIDRIFSRTLHDRSRDVCWVHLDERPIPVFIIESYCIRMSIKMINDKVAPGLLSSSPEDT